MPIKHVWGDPAYPWGSFRWGEVDSEAPTGVLIDTKHFHAKAIGRKFQVTNQARAHSAGTPKRAFMYQLGEVWDE